MTRRGAAQRGLSGPNVAPGFSSREWDPPRSVQPTRAARRCGRLRQSLDTVGAFLGPALAIGLMWLTASNFRACSGSPSFPAFLSLALILFAVHEPARPEGLRKVRSPLNWRRTEAAGVVLVGGSWPLQRCSRWRSFSEAFTDSAGAGGGPAACSHPVGAGGDERGLCWWPIQAGVEP